MKTTKMSSQEESNFILDFLENSQHELYKSYHKDLEQTTEDFFNTFLKHITRVSPENKQTVMKSVAIHQKHRETGETNVQTN